MTSSSRQSRRDAARARETSSSRNRWLLVAIGGGVILVAAVAAIALSGGSGDGGSSALPSGAPAVSVAPGTAPTVTGDALPTFSDPVADTAVGLTIPTVTSKTASGESVDIALNGKPKALVFLAHWCSHCQAEVPVIQSMVDEGGWPADVELISVSTAMDPTAPNYPPEEWLNREGWTAPVITDPTGEVSTAFGLSAFPYLVFVNADGTVQGRMTGEVPADDLATILASLDR